MPTNTFRQKNPKNKHTKLHLVFDEDSRRSFLTGFHKRKLERKKFHQQKLEDAKKEEMKKEKQEKKRAFEESMKTINFPEPKEIVPSDGKVHELEDHTVTVTDVNSVDLLAAHGGIGENKVEYENDGEEEEDQEDESEEFLSFPVNKKLLVAPDYEAEEIIDKKHVEPAKVKRKPHPAVKQRKEVPRKEKSSKKRRKGAPQEASSMKKKKLSKMSTAKKRAMKRKAGKRR